MLGSVNDWYWIKWLKHYVKNGLKLWSTNYEANRKTQSSGISVVTESDVTYCGVLTDIIELNYLDSIRHVLFKCKWIDIHSMRGYKIDELEFPLVNFIHLMHGGDELID